MRLTSTALTAFQNINSFRPASQWSVRLSDPNTLYFQLFDLDNTSLPAYSPMNGGFFNSSQPSPQRYIAGVTLANQPASMTVTFPSLDPTHALTYVATQDPNDGSVWSISIPGYLNAGVGPSSGNVLFSLTQSTTILKWTVQNFISVEMSNQGSC